MKKLLGLIFLLPSTLFVGESGIAQIVTEPRWTGFYIGGNLGGIWSKFHGSVADLPYIDHDGVFFPSFAQTWNVNPNSFVGGAQLGYAYQSGHFVYGTEVSIMGLNIEDTHILRPDEVGEFINIFKAGDSFSSKINWQASWVVRLGQQQQNWLFYGLGGVAIMKPKISTNITSIEIDGDLFPATQGSEEKTMLGGTIGVGTEYALWSNLKIGMEYRYTDYGNHHYNVGQNPVSTLPDGFIYTALRADKKLTTNLLSFRINYYFNN